MFFLLGCQTLTVVNGKMLADLKQLSSLCPCSFPLWLASVLSDDK